MDKQQGITDIIFGALMDNEFFINDKINEFWQKCCEKMGVSESDDITLLWYETARKAFEIGLNIRDSL